MLISTKHINLIIFVVIFNSITAAAQIKKNESTNFRTLVHNAAFIGLWTPTGQASLLGNHFAAGFRIGAAKKKMRYDFIMEFRVGKTANNYTVKYNDTTVVSTDHFFGGYFGINVSRDVLVTEHSTYYVLGGIGIDVFDAIEKDLPKFPKNRSIGSLNYSIGLGRRNYPFKNYNMYVAVEACYNFVDYQNSGGTLLSGNSLNFRLILGGIFKYRFVKRISHRVY